MDYAARLQSIGQEYNALSAQLQQPLNRLSFLQGQIDIIMALQAEDEAAKKAALEAAKKASEEAAVKETSNFEADVKVDWVPGTQSSPQA